MNKEELLEHYNEVKDLVLRNVFTINEASHYASQIMGIKVKGKTKNEFLTNLYNTIEFGWRVK
jgi:hypothetical protein